MSKCLTFAALILALALNSQEAMAQTKHVRQGFWFHGGLGYGSLGCQDCSRREGGPVGIIALGGTISQSVNLGGAIHVWAKEVNGVTLTVGTVTALIRFYTSKNGGFYLEGGLGAGGISADYGYTTVNENGVGAVLGLGYDIRIGKMVSLTPFWSGVGVSASNDDANFGQIGLGITVH